MQSALIVLLACVVSAAADAAAEASPFGFLFNRCVQSDDDGNVGNCVRDLLREALDRDRPKFSTGLQVGSKTVVLEPLDLPKPNDTGRQGRSKKLSVTKAQLTGLASVQLESVMLTNTTAAAMVGFPALAAEARAKIKYGFLPLWPKLQVSLEQPRLLVGANWSANDGQLQLEEPHAKLWLAGYNITIDGLTSMGRNLAQALNENSADIIEFLTPSLEAAVVRRVKKLDQEERNAALRWLEKALS